MAGYSRQSVADIIANAVIKAAPVNAEYNAIRDAFAFSGGHKHDGSSTEGAYVPLIADTDALNKVVVDTTNNRIGIFTEVSSAAVEQIRIQDGAIVPVTDNDIDLGTSSLKYKNIYVNGIASIGSITLSGGTIDNTVIGGTTPAAGTFTSMTATTADINGGTIDGTTIGGTTAAAGSFTTLGASGAVTLASTLGVTGVTTLGTANITSVDINSGAMDGTTIGASTAAAGTFTNLTATGTTTLTTVDINGGAIDGTAIGASSASTGAFTTLSATGTSTLSTVDINAGNIDGTVIGASSAAAGSFTTVSTSGQATLATVDINGGAIDGTTIGATTSAAITGTTVTATSFVGPVTGNVTGNLTGNVTGNVTGDVTGNVTASSGTSTFNNVTVNGTLNMDAGTTATITNLTSPTNTNDAATKGYVDTAVANVVDAAPAALDTLNELAAALGDDANFSTTVTNSIATKLPLAGGTMTGAIAMGTNKITGLGDPTAAQDAATQNYVTTNFLGLSGGTMTGAIDMGSAKITTTYTPTNAADLTTKTYVDGILGSATAAAASASAAATSETNAATSETNAANSATSAASSATSAAASYDSFDDRYLGAKASAPTVDNDGDALITGALYFNTTTDTMQVYGSSGWTAAGSSVNGTTDRNTYTATSGQTTFAATYDAGYVDVYLNGVKLLLGTDFTATSGTSIVLTTGATAGDIVDIVAYGTFVLADHLTETQSDAKYVEVAGDTMTGNLNVGGTVTADGLNVNADNTNAPQVVFENSHSVTTDAAISTYDDAAGVGITLGSNYYLNSAGSEARFNTSEESAGILVDRIGVITLKTDNSGSAVAKDRLNIAGNGDISFYEDTGTTAKFFWDASAESLGIGTTSPAGGIDATTALSDAYFFKGSHATTTNFYITNTNATSGNTANLYLAPANGVAGSYISSIAIEDFSVSANRTADLAFYTRKDGTFGEHMRIDSSGNVGIGTTSPSLGSNGSGLHIKGASGVYGVLKVDSSTTSEEGWVQFSNNGVDKFRIASDSSTNLKFIHSGVAERMRIDSSGNLLVGKTSTSTTVAGIVLNDDGRLFATGEGGSGHQAARFTRLSNDGDIVNFYKDSTEVGSIYNGGGNLGINSSGGLLLVDDIITPTSGNDATYDIGRSLARYKDLYLSGGVVETTTTVSYAASIALTYDNGSIQTVTLTGNVTFTDSIADGESIVLMLNAGASYTVTFPTMTWVSSGGNAAPTLTANDTIVFWKIGSTLYGAYAGSYT